MYWKNQVRCTLVARGYLGLFSFLFLREGLLDLACLLRYSRERALKSSKVRALGNLNSNLKTPKLLFAAQETLRVCPRSQDPWLRGVPCHSENPEVILRYVAAQALDRDDHRIREIVGRFRVEDVNAAVVGG